MFTRTCAAIECAGRIGSVPDRAPAARCANDSTSNAAAREHVATPFHLRVLRVPDFQPGRRLPIAVVPPALPFRDDALEVLAAHGLEQRHAAAVDVTA
jgi:hypothetical protein